MHCDVWVGEEDFEVGATLARIRERTSDVGAVVSFVGLVRERTQSISSAATALYLEHYPGVTERSIRAIVAQAAARWPISDVVVLHRVGWLGPSAQIVLVAVASAHRRAAFDACTFVMDYLKTDAVFWKKERRADGSEHWIESSAGDLAAVNAWQGVETGARPAPVGA